MFPAQLTSGPLLDSIDIQIEVPAVPQEDLTRTACGEPSASIRARVTAAHVAEAIQYRRFYRG